MKDLRGIIRFIKTMRILRLILFMVIILFAIALISLHVFVNLKGRELLTKKLQDTFHKEITIGSLSTSFPFNVQLKDIQSKGLFKIERIIAGGGLFDIFRASFGLSSLKIINPEVTIERSFVGAVAQAVTPIDASSPDKANSPSPNLNPLALPQNSFLSPRFIIRRLIISDGIVNFTDNLPESRVITIKVNNINIRVDNLNFSGWGNQLTYFKFSGTVPWSATQEAGKISGEGWINLFKKDVQATLKIQNIDAIYLYPYYSQWVDLEKARIESAKLDFSSNIQGLNNDVTADCHIELTDIVRKPRPPEEEKDKAEKITDIVLGIFKALDKGKIELNFTIKTKMTSPEFLFGPIKSAVEDKLAKARGANSGFKPQDVLMLPGNILTGTVRSVTDLSKALIDGTFAVGNEFKKAVGDSFRKEKTNPQ